MTAVDVLAGFRAEAKVQEESIDLARKRVAEAIRNGAFADAATSATYANALEGTLARLRYRISEAEEKLSEPERTPGQVARDAYHALPIGFPTGDWEIIAAAVLAHGRGR